MTETGLTKLERITTFTMMTRLIALGLATTTGGCISITAPDKPIEINLNINVTQEVVYRLDGEAKSLIQQNPGIF
jgi:hypothetical protein